MTPPSRFFLTLRFLFGVLLALLIVGAVGRAGFARQTPPELVRQGNKAWDEHSYGLALEAYQKALAADPNLPDRAEIEYRTAEALGRSEKWDEAVTAIEAYVRKYRDTPFEARGQVWRGRLYALVPHAGYQVGKKIYRGQNVPRSEGKEPPRYVNLAEEDAENVIEAFVRAKTLLERLRSQGDARARASWTRLEIEVNFDLANFYLAHNERSTDNLTKVDWTIDLTRPFDPHWPLPKREMYLYEQIAALDATLPDSDHHPTVLAAFAKAAYILQLRQDNPFYYPAVRIGKRLYPYQYAARYLLYIPYRDIDPIKTVQDILSRYPNDREADRLAYTVAVWTDQKGDEQAAVSLYSAFLSRYPASLRHSDAEERLKALLQPAMTVDVPHVTQPGKRAVVMLTTRNLSQVRFTAYRIYPEEVYGHVEGKTEPYGWLYRPAFSDFEHQFIHPYNALRYRREKVAEWTATTSDNGKHALVKNTMTTPLDTLGAYLIEAHAGQHDELSTATIAFVSDVTLVQKVDRDSLLVYAADKATGRPLPSVRLTIWKPTHLNQDYEARYTSGVTDSEGLFRDSLPEPIDGSAGWESPGLTAQVFAVAGPNRYALSAATGNSMGGVTPHRSRVRHTAQSETAAGNTAGDLPARKRIFRAFISTDRPLYRPKQTVYFRIVTAEGEPGHYTPAVGLPAQVSIEGPRGELVHKTVRMGAFGSYADSVSLPSGADLGRYRVMLKSVGTSEQNGRTYGEQEFRVEEYKKPEFTVRVQPDKAQVRTGETVRAVVSARYFFGAPVVGARVHYRVFRAPSSLPAPFPPRPAWFDPDERSGYFAAFQERYRSEYYRNAALFGNSYTAYREGDLHTDAKGEAVVSFPTDLPGNAIASGIRPDQSFSIFAEVTDASRRQVSGAGTAQAASTQFRAFMRLERRFLLAGEPLKIEIATRDAANRPFAAEGRVTIYRLLPAIPEKRGKDPITGKEIVLQKAVPQREEKEGSLFVPTDAQDGNGFAIWPPDTPADYRLEYAANDAWGNTITAEDHILVYGPNFDDRLDKDDDRFQLLPEFADYRPGETARVLLVTPAADSYVLFTEAAVGRIARSRVLFVPGRSTIVNVPITGADIPNAQFAATLVRAGEVRETQADIGVPAEDKIMALTVTPDKATYRPGERATLTIHATNAQGRPARGEICLSVVDDALLAIQPDLTPDIRRFFYGSRIETAIGGDSSVQFDPGHYPDAPSPDLSNPNGPNYPEDMGTLQYQGHSVLRLSVPSYVESGREEYEELMREEREQKKRRTHPPTGRSFEFQDQSGAGGLGGSRGGFGGGLGGYDGRMLRRKGAPGPQGPPGETPEEANEEASNAPALGMQAEPPGALGPLAEATVRRLFADSAFWTPAVVTDADGHATVSFTFPDNITRWHITARGVTEDVNVGVAEAETVAKKNLLVRLQAPRFFTERDQVTLSANIHNYLDRDKSVRVELVTDGEHVALDSGAANAAARTISVSTDGEARADWTVSVKQPGLTKIKVIAQTDQESDAAELEFPVLVHGVEKFSAQNGILRDGGEATLTFDLPELRRTGATLLDVQLQPSLAAVLLDALPYLEDYPYGCVEQTLSRFVPTVLVAKTLRDAGIDLETVGKRAKALEEQRKAVPPQQVIADSGYTYPKGVPGALQADELARRLALGYHGRSAAPVFDSKTLQAMTADGLQRLYAMQRDDGSWGWWPGSAQGDPYLTAYVVEGMIHAEQAGVSVKPDVLTKADAYLLAHLENREDLSLCAYVAYVLSLPGPAQAADRHAANPTDYPRFGRNERESAPNTPAQAAARYARTLDFLYERRDRLSPYAQALLALAVFNADGGKDARAGVLVRNLETTARRDNARGTVHWEGNEAAYWRWDNDREETTAMVLRALIHIAPQEQLAPQNGPQAAQTGLAPLAVRWLVDNRRGGRWTSTRQTANVVNALLEYARAQRELTPDYTVTVDVDGKVRKTYHITRDNALLFDNRFLVGDEILASGGNQLHLSMQGTGTLYYSAYLNYFDRQEPIRGIANAVGVERKVYKIVSTAKKDRQGQSVTEETRVPLTDGATLTSGDILETELYLKSDNDYSYVVIEDRKPAGCEPLATRSGEAYGDGFCSNMELRDEKVAFFVDELPQGTRRITYRMRAEVPGTFHALPANVYAMYAPDIRALSDEWRVTILDQPALPVQSTRR